MHEFVKVLGQLVLKVIGQYAQVSRQVLEVVLTDINLAVQEKEPDMALSRLVDKPG